MILLIVFYHAMRCVVTGSMLRQIIVITSLTVLTGNALAGEGVIQRGGYLQRQDIQTFITMMVKTHGQSETKLRRLFGQAKRQQRVLDLVQKPAEGKPWSDYRPIFLTDKRIDAGVQFWNAHQEILDRAEAEYGVPREIIVAIIGVETFYGTRMGRFPVFDTLVTLGFDYPKRGPFFTKQLEHYLQMTQEESLPPLELKGSYAGAMGMGQFIPSSYRDFAVDFNGDGRRDLFHSVDDAIGSVANYFKHHQWHPGEEIISRARAIGNDHQALKANDRKPGYTLRQLKAAKVYPRGAVAPNETLVYLRLQGKDGLEHWVGHHNFYVITQYNHSVKYALAVYQLSQAIMARRRHRDQDISTSPR